MATATAPTNADQLYAARAFPNYRVHGTGTILVRKVCCMEAELVETEQAAMIVKAAQCCRYCSMRHFVHHKKAAPAPQCLKVGYGRDRD